MGRDWAQSLQSPTQGSSHHRGLPAHAWAPRTRRAALRLPAASACSHTSGNHAGTARAAMATSHSVAITEPQLPREGSALLSITGLVLTLPPLPKPSPSAIPAPTWPLWFVTDKFCSLAPGLEIMQIHFFPRCKEVLPGLCNALVLRSTNTGLSMCLKWETRWQKHLQPVPRMARVNSMTELHNHCYALKSSEFYMILAIFPCCDRFQDSACCTVPSHPLLRVIFLGDITNCSTWPRTWCPRSWSCKMVLGSPANSHVSGRCAFPSTKREQTESVGLSWRPIMRPKGSIRQNPLAPLLGLPTTRCWTTTKRCSL